MLYNLRIGKSQYTGKTPSECCDIIAARCDKINAENRTPVDRVLYDVRNMDGKYRRMAYYDHNGKIFLSINRAKGEK